MSDVLGGDGAGVVVAGVDGSANSRAALAVAAEVARRREWRLHVILAWTLPAPSGGAGSRFPVSTADPAEHQAGAQARLEAIVHEVFGGQRPAELTVAAIHGAPVKALTDAGRVARLLVVGARGGGGVAGLRVGSVSEQLVHHAPCPVLVVPAGRDRPPEAPRQDAGD